MRMVHEYSWKKILWFGIFLTCSWGVFSQDYDYINYTTKDGLPTNYVYGVIEDDDGYIWAYTENGMSKFDGYTFQNFNTKDGLPGNDIVNAVKDKDGKIFLWAYNNRPSYLYKDSFHVIHDVPCAMVNGLDDGYMDYYCEDFSLISFRENKTVSIQYGIIDSFLLMKERDAFELMKSTLLPADTKINYFFKKPFYLVIDKDSVNYYTPTKESTLRIFNDGYLALIKDAQKAYWKSGNRKEEMEVGEFLVFEKGNVQQGLFDLGTVGKFLIKNSNFGFLYLDFNKKEFKKLDSNQHNVFPESHAEISVFDSTFMISTDRGILEYDLDGNFIEKLMLPDLAENYYLHRGYKDSQGNFWLGTREGGLFFFPKQKRNTSRLTSSFSNDKTFERIISTSDGLLLGITDNSGVYQIKENEVVNISPPIKKTRFRAAINTTHGIIISSSSQDFLIKNVGDRFTIGRVRDQFNFRIKNQGTNPELPSNLKWLSKLNNAVSLSYDENNQIFYTSRYQSWFHKYQLGDLEGNEVEYARLNGGQLHFHTDQDKLFLGRNEGLFMIQNLESISFLSEYDALKNISTIAGRADNLWIGTEGNGLFHYSFLNQELIKISNAANIRRIKSNEEHLFVATNEGVLVISKNNPTGIPIVKFTLENGLPSNEIQDVHPTEDGKYIYVATTEGLYKIDRTANFKTSLLPEKLHLQSVAVNQKTIPIIDDLSVSHLENNLEFEYHLQSYASNGNITYFTKLEPIQKDWEETKERKINYFSLLPKQYTFHLKAKDAYGNEVAIKPLAIKIRKAFWQTVGFKLLTVLSFLGLLLYWFLNREKKQKEELRKEKIINRRMAELELSALRAQMNPHFVFNALGAIQYYIQTNEVEAADSYLTKFARLMRKYLESSKQKMIPLGNEIELLQIYTDLEKLRFEDLFTVNIAVAKDLDADDIYLPSMLVQPFVENAINHGLDERRDKKGILSIRFYEEKETLICEVNDNGVGRKNTTNAKRKGHQFRGMGIIKEKVQTLRASELFDISIDIKDLNPADSQFPGTQIILRIKNLQNDHD